jgi:Zn-dependent protease
MRGIVLANYILALPGIVFAVAIHEYFKASISYRLGDPYPKLHGRLRFSPLRHLEPIGFLLMLLYGYGWGKPVATSDTYYKDRKRGAVLTYAAPSFINLLAAFAVFILLLAAKNIAFSLGCSLPLSSQGFALGLQTIAGLGYTGNAVFSAQPALLVATGTLYQIGYMFVRYNVAIAFINLIPIYPLDGSAILEAFLPPAYRYKFGEYKSILVPILLLLFIVGFVNAAFDPLLRMILQAIY